MDDGRRGSAPALRPHDPALIGALRAAHAAGSPHLGRSALDAVAEECRPDSAAFVNPAKVAALLAEQSLGLFRPLVA